jgi:hypothetical protein
MVETRWPGLDGTELQYGKHRWELTGAVDVRGTGDLLEVEAAQVDDVRRGKAALRFGLENPPASLNPENLDGRFERLDREGDRVFLVVRAEPRTYRYELHGVEPK